MWEVEEEEEEKECLVGNGVRALSCVSHSYRVLPIVVSGCGEERFYIPGQEEGRHSED